MPLIIMSAAEAAPDAIVTEMKNKMQFYFSARRYSKLIRLKISKLEPMHKMQRFTKLDIL